jgi:hypothetical protein
VPGSRFAGQLSPSPAVPDMTSSKQLDLEGHHLLFRTIGPDDGVLATIVHVPDMQVICSGDIVYNNTHMWLWNSTPESREAWLADSRLILAAIRTSKTRDYRLPLRRRDLPPPAVHGDLLCRGICHHSDKTSNRLELVVKIGSIGATRLNSPAEGGRPVRRPG